MSKLDEYRAKLAAMDDDELVKEAEDKVWLSAFANNNPRSAYHAECDATYDECRRREKPWLYQRGWNRSDQLAGYQPSQSDMEAARARSEP